MAIKKVKEAAAINYGLSRVITVKFNLNLPKQKYDPKNVLIDYNMSPQIKLDSVGSLIIISVQIRAAINETKEEVLSIETLFFYKAENLNNYITEDKEKGWKFKDKRHLGLLTTLIGISISTMRGIMIEKSKGTLLDGKMLPIINPNTFIKNQ